MRHRILKTISFLVIFFFVWTAGGIFNVAYAAYNETQKPSVNQKQTQRPEDKFQQAIEDIKNIIRGKADNNENKSITSKISAVFETKKSRLKAKRGEIESFDNAIRGQFAATEKKLKDARLPAEILQRHHDFVKHYEDNLRELRTNLDAADKAKTKAEFDSRIQKVQQHLDKVSPPRKHKALDPNKLPHRISDLKRKEPRTKPAEFLKDIKQTANVILPSTQESNQPVLLASNGSLAGLLESLPKVEKQLLPEPLILAQASNPPTDADLAETIDVQLTPAIKAKAAELNYSPVKIYNWVRNNVEYVPTYGSIQGADMCLQTKQGNDFDIASLLIALLRASNIPAKYVYGTIELPIEKVMNWVGGFTDAKAALDFIASGGTPVAGIISGGKISFVRMEHVWVEAWINYYPLRGAAHKTGKGDTWIPLDASYKQYTYTQGIDIKAAVPFDAQTFVNQIQSTATIDPANSSVTNINSTYIQQQMQNYQTQVKNYIDQNYPNATVGDVLGKKEIIKQEFTYLLGTLPYRKWTIGIKYSEIPDNLRHKITFEVTNPSSYESDLVYTVSLPELSQKRITLSYSPATQDDKNVILSTGNSNSVAAYLVNLRPELKIEGVSKAIGTSISMGTTENFTMTFIMPGNIRDVVANDVIAGEYYAIAVNHGVMNEVLVQNRINRLDATNDLFKSGQLNKILLDDVIGESLYVLAATYFLELDTFNATNAKISKIASARLPSEAIVSQGLNISYLYSVPCTATLGSLKIDVDRDIKTVATLDGDTVKAREYMSSTGVLGSALEHGIFEQAFSKESISAVKALNIANSNGIPIYQINKDNVSQILPQLQVSNEVKTDIVNSINAGKEVTISKTNISLYNWSGVGYIVKNPNTGAAAYLISGGMAGGAIVDNISNILNQIASLFASPAEASDGTQNDQENIIYKIHHYLELAVIIGASISGAIALIKGCYAAMGAVAGLMGGLSLAFAVVIVIFIIAVTLFLFYLLFIAETASYYWKKYAEGYYAFS